MPDNHIPTPPSPLFIESVAPTAVRRHLLVTVPAGAQAAITPDYSSHA